LQFVELQGLQFIGLGALADELTPRERVYDTLEQLRTRTERLVCIGYLIDKPSTEERGASITKTTYTVPLDVWAKTNGDSQQASMSSQVRSIVDLTTSKRFHALKDELTAQLRKQKHFPSSSNNKYLAGITAHNLGVLAVLTGKPDEAVSYFREAICLKEAAFGRNDAEVALSWDELGIQFFARGDFDGALTSFREAHGVRNGLIREEQQLIHSQSSRSSRSGGGGGSASSPTPPASPAQHPSVAITLNNMACCYFQMGNARQALRTLEEADEILQKAVGSSVQAELDLLHVAIVICNCGYMKLALKQYEEARSLLEEALLIQQSVLDDNHRAVRDTLSNIEFANAFHS
jgi:tetratricopeptide (TPR) repeat protein